MSGRGSPRAARPGAAAGFTLLEVMVALAILAMSLMAVSDVVSGALRNHARARELDVATLLARAKMAELEDHYEADGFRDTDETQEGTFEDDGHPEIRWKADVIAPDMQDGGQGLCSRLLGEFAPQQLLGAAAGTSSSTSASSSSPGAGSSGGPTTGASPQGLAMAAAVQQQCTQLAQDVRKGVREVRLEIAWGSVRTTESFTVVTHLVVLQTGKAATP